MGLTIELPPRVARALERYCTTHSLTRSQAVMQALEQLLSRATETPTPYELGKMGFGTDTSGPPNVAQNTKRLLRERLCGRTLRSR